MNQLNIFEKQKAKAYCEDVLERNKCKAASGLHRDVADALFQAVQDLSLASAGASTSTLDGKLEGHAESPQRARLGRLARWQSDLEELISDRFTEILSRDTHPEK
jgi:predicted Abi (CAAX) family protease